MLLSTDMPADVAVKTDSAPRGQRYDAFRGHLRTCPKCASETEEMCYQGYWLLIGALGIVSNSPLLSV